MGDIMDDEMDDDEYIEALRHRISDLKAMLKEQYQKTSNLEQRLAEAHADIRAAITDYRNEHAKLEEATALLERWKASIADEVVLTPEEVAVQHDTTYFLAKK